MTRPWLRRLLRYCATDRLALWCTVIGSASLALAALLPNLTKDVVDAATTGNLEVVPRIVVLLVGIAVVRFATSFLRRWAAGRLSLGVQHRLRQDVFASIQRLDGAGQDRLRTGQVVSRANSDLQMVQGLLGMAPMALGQGVLFLASVVFMVVLSPALALIALVVVPGGLYLARTTRNLVFPSTWAAQQAAADVAEIVEEDVTGVRVVKGFGQESREVSRLGAAGRELYAQRLRAVRQSARVGPALAALTTLGQVLVLLIGGAMTISGSISLGTFVAFTMYLATLAAPTRIVTMLVVLGQQAAAAVGRVFDLIDLDVEVTDPTQPLPLPPGPVAVEFENVDFGYAIDQSVLTRFTLRVPAGSTVAVVGPSGSGKSTLSLLMPRFYDPAHGRITLGGVDLRDLSLADLRSQVGVVFEEAFLFSASVRDNIAYGRPEATIEQVRAAARAAEAQEFIDALPAGYDSLVGERGLTLSGGQRQRIALARAMIADPRVLVLDDATSAVDPATEAAIHATLRRLTADRTTVLIAHRRSTLELADTVAVVVDGAVVDHGTDEQLRRRCPLYVDLLGTDLADLADLAEPAEPPDSDESVHPAEPATIGVVTPALWPPRDPLSAGQRRVHESARPKIGGGGGANNMGNAVAALAATPELLERVEALPPAADLPEIEPDLTDTPAARTVSVASMFRKVRGLLALSAVLLALDAVAEAAMPALIRHGVDAGVSRSSMTAVYVMTIAALGVLAVDYLLQRWQAVVTGRAGESLLYDLRLREFAHLQRLGLDFYEREMAGRIMTRMTTDVDALSSFLQTGLVTAAVSIGTFVVIAAALLLMNAELAAIAFASLPVLIISTLIFRSYSSRAYTRARALVSVVNADLQEKVAGLRVAQALGREQVNAQGFAEKSDAYRSARMRAQTALALYFPFIAMLADVAAALVLGVGAGRVVAGTLTAGTLLAFVLYLDSFFTPIQQLSQVFDGYQQAAVGLTRIRELLRISTSTPPATNPIDPGRLTGRVQFDGVDFGYGDDGRLALSGVNLTLHPGETVAVVGATGAGKSSLIKLIARFYDVTAGVVRVDGRDIRDLDLDAYRHRLGVVPQEAHLFSGSVRDNIAYGRPDATDAQVEAAARRIGALAVVASLPGGFRHQVDERGRNLSASQRQLISLARAELVCPDILLLDEATASLDPAAELTVLSATERLAAPRTTVVVAHRLATASRADRIVVMDHGRIVEIGTHEGLLADPASAYSGLYRLDEDETGANASAEAQARGQAGQVGRAGRAGVTARR